MTFVTVGRPARKRTAVKVSYNLDVDIREILRRIAIKEGRPEGYQVEQLVLFYEAVQRLVTEGQDLTLNTISQKISEIWDEILSKPKD